MMNVFINEKEQRPRAGWRILLQLSLFAVFVFIMGLVSKLFIKQQLEIYTALALGIGGVGSVWVAAILIDRREFEEYGLGWDATWKKELVAGLVIGTLAMSFIFLMGWNLNWINVTGVGWEKEFSLPYLLLFANYLLAMIVIGIYEELVFRGYHILNLMEGFQSSADELFPPACYALLVSALLFGMGHAFNPHASWISTLNIILAGAILGVPYLLTGRIALSAGLHISWNFVQGGIFGFPVSGIPFQGSLLQSSLAGPELFTGGRFGPEAGVMGLIGIILIVTMYLLYLYHRDGRHNIDSTFARTTSNFKKTDEQN